MNQKESIHVMGCPVHDLTMSETIAEVEKAVRERRQIHHVVVNAAKLVQMRDDPVLRESVVSSDLINADGASVVLLSRLKGTPLKERVAGCDLMQELVDVAGKKGWKIYFFGAEEEVVREVVSRYSREYGPDIVAGYRNGYYKEEEEAAIAEAIARTGANLLFVAISSPRKENFLYRYRQILKDVNFIMGVGGTFDIVAGKTRRAPVFLQRIGMEWFFRVLQEPGRMWKRYLVTNTRFLLLAIPEIFRAWRDRERKGRIARLG